MTDSAGTALAWPQNEINTGRRVKPRQCGTEPQVASPCGIQEKGNRRRFSQEDMFLLC